jgi:hypothetical protein
MAYTEFLKWNILFNSIKLFDIIIRKRMF